MAATANPARWLDPDERAAWLSLTGVTIRLLPALDAQLERDAGINYFEYSVLAMLVEQPEHTLRMSDLARVTNSSLSRLSHVAKRLETAGLLRREPDACDGRCTNAVVTDAGAAKVAVAAPGHVAEVRRLVFNGLPKAHVIQMRRINETILDQIAPGSSGEPFGKGKQHQLDDSPPKGSRP